MLGKTKDSPRAAPWILGLLRDPSRGQEAWLVGEATKEVMNNRRQKGKGHEGPVTDTPLPKLGTWVTRRAFQSTTAFTGHCG